MAYWVYIKQEEHGKLVPCISVYFGKEILDCISDIGIVYLRPFSVPMDALAHKHLLDDLSKETLVLLIKQNKVKTDILLEQIHNNK